MNTFNKKSLYVAIAAIGAVGAGSAQAVNIAIDGLGEVLVYPYYTINNDPTGHAVQHASVGGQHDRQHEGREDALPRRQEQPRSS